MRGAGIFACPATAYGGNHYLGYCQGSAYGDYDHGAVWFGLEPGVREAAAAADVLFLGNSRMQFGFSAPALGQWFAEAPARATTCSASATTRPPSSPNRCSRACSRRRGPT